MSKQNIEESVESRVCFEELEDWVGEKIQGWVQELLEEEVTELLGRRKSERRRAVDAPSGYRNGYGKPRHLTLSSGTIQVRRPRVRDLEEHFESRVLPLFTKRTRQVRELIPELYLHGLALGDFMRTLDIYAGGGNAHTKLRNQMKRLFGCTVSLIYEDKNGQASVNALIARRTELWWNERKPDEQTLWESKIELSEDFFNEIIRHPVPLDLNTLTALKRCSLGLDLYLWLAYRTFALRAPLRLSWRQVYCQFGVGPTKANEHRTVQDFRRKVLRELKKIKLAWPDLNYTTAPGVLILLPSTPPIAPSDQGQLGPVSLPIPAARLASDGPSSAACL